MKIFDAIFKLNLLLLFVFAGINLKAQEVIASSGDFFADSTTTISWTLGEIFTQTYSDTNTILTQGFQQSKVTAAIIKTFDSLTANVYVFPNPTQEKLNIIRENEDTKTINYALVSLNGSIIRQGKFTGKTGEVMVFDLVPGVYILKIYNYQSRLQKTFKIVRN